MRAETLNQPTVQVSPVSSPPRAGFFLRSSMAVMRNSIPWLAENGCTLPSVPPWTAVLTQRIFQRDPTSLTASRLSHDGPTATIRLRHLVRGRAHQGPTTVNEVREYLADVLEDHAERYQMWLSSE